MKTRFLIVLASLCLSYSAAAQPCLDFAGNYASSTETLTLVQQGCESGNWVQGRTDLRLVFDGKKRMMMQLGGGYISGSQHLTLTALYLNLELHQQESDIQSVLYMDTKYTFKTPDVLIEHTVMSDGTDQTTLWHRK